LLKKISTAVREIVEANALLRLGFHHQLLNLSQVARFIRPLVEARTHKEVSDSAVLMSLSRLQTKLKQPAEFEGLVVENISIHSGLCSLTVFKTIEIRKQLNDLFTVIRSRGGFITITEGLSEITAILEDRDFKIAESMITEKLRYVHRDIASVSVKLSDRAIATPGSIYQLLQQLALQNINVIEVMSTATEFNIHLKRDDVRLAFDSIYQRFSASRDGNSLI
jgi:aspartokinase